MEIPSVPNENEKESDCFNVVQRHVEKHGGKRIMGWEVRKWNGYLEAEAHAVWENENLELIDVSPKPEVLRFDTCLFIEDPRLSYEGKQIGNHYLNVTSNSVVDDLIEVSKLFFYLQNKGIRANYHDLSEILSQEEIREITEIVNWRLNLVRYIHLGGNDKSTCYCGSGKRYKNCHRLKVRDRLNMKV